MALMRNPTKLALALATAMLAAACSYGLPQSSLRPVGYYGYHPYARTYGRGSFCYLSGPHSHDYSPLRSHRYVFHRGYYYWIGDPRPFDYRYATYAYFGHHPHPYGFGGYCYISGGHHHHYAPIHAHHYDRRRDVYYFIGHYEPAYHEGLHLHDAKGRRRDRTAQGYHEHEGEEALTGQMPLAAEMPDSVVDQGEAREDDTPPQGKPRIRRPRSDRKRAPEPAAGAPAVTQETDEASPLEASPAKAPRWKKRSRPAATAPEVEEPSEPAPQRKRPLPRSRRQTRDAEAGSGDHAHSDPD